MGQLEKYGLYVLCLVIFLILGVTIWGGGDLPPSARRSAQTPGSELNANPRAPAANGSGANGPAANGSAAKGATSGVRTNEAGAKVPDLSSLLRPVERPPTDPKKIDAKAVDANAQAKPPADAGSETGKVKVDAGKPPTDTPRPTYKIQRGDTFDSIAKQKLGAAALRTEIARLNPRVEPSRLQIGQELLLPTAAELAGTKSTVDASGSPQASQPATAPGKYTVAKGDTFESIARRQLGSSKRVGELRELNATIDPTRLRVGQKIDLPKK